MLAMASPLTEVVGNLLSCYFVTTMPVLYNGPANHLEFLIEILLPEQTVYVPDFLMVYIDKSQQKHVEVIEVKPTKEAILENTKSIRDRAVLALNTAKWAAASEFCKRLGMRFRVVTEQDIYQNTGRRR